MKARAEFSRRSLLQAGVAAGLTTVCSKIALGQTCNAPTTVLKPKPEKAVSLLKLGASMSAGGTPRLPGLTRLDGFITDPDTRDVILWGLSERDQPDLHLDDFVVGLRSAFDRYNETRGGTTYISTPLISIDPDPDVFRALRALDVAKPAGRQQFAQICARPQTVRVEGMPRHTRLAKALVDADYRMKRVGQGTVTLPITSPFPGHHAAQAAKWRAAALREQWTPDQGSNTRYWFEAGVFNYQGSSEADIAFLDGDTVFFDIAQVVLRDEDQRLEAKGLAASGKINPTSRAFACAWTQRMEDIYRAEPIWRDMQNIYRHFAVARAIVNRKAFGRVGFPGDFLLDRYNVAQVSIPTTLPGLGHAHTYDVPVKSGTASYSGWVCGGVSIDFNSSLPATPASVETQGLARRVIARRPERDAISWTVK
jgi:hypothetical protein